MKLLQITALALLLHAPFSYGMNDNQSGNGQCTASSFTIQGIAALSAAGITTTQYLLNKALEKKVKTVCDKECERLEQLEEGESRTDESEIDLNVRRRRLTPQEAATMERNTLEHAQGQVAEEHGELSSMAFGCCAAAIISSVWKLIDCL